MVRRKRRKHRLCLFATNTFFPIPCGGEGPESICQAWRRFIESLYARKRKWSDHGDRHLGSGVSLVPFAVRPTTDAQVRYICLPRLRNAMNLSPSVAPHVLRQLSTPRSPRSPPPRLLPRRRTDCCTENRDESSRPRGRGCICIISIRRDMKQNTRMPRPDCPLYFGQKNTQHRNAPTTRCTTA